MNRFRLLTLALLASLALGQQPVTVGLSTPAPPPPSATAVVIGNPGNSQYNYFVIANYPSGSATSAPALVQFAPTLLSVSNFIQIGWTPLSGVTTYDVVRLQAPFPFSGSCVSCKVASGLTANSVQDTGSALTNYTAGSTTIPGQGTIYINTRDYSSPQMRQVVNGVDAALGAGGGVASVTGVLPVTSTGGANPVIGVNKATTSTLGVVKPDNVTVTVDGTGALSAIASGTVTGVTASAPITSSGGATPNISATYQGNGAKVQASTGTTTTNDCVKFDAAGNTVDSGAACAAAGVTSVTGTSPIVSSGGTTPAVSCPTCTVGGVTTVTATAPITSTGGATPVISAAYQGNGTKIQLSTGGAVTDDCAKFDANGNIVDAGAACASGTVMGVTGTSPIVSSGGAAPAISCATCVTAVTGTAPIVSSGGTTPAISVGTATTSVLGVVKPDGTTIAISAGVITAVGPATQTQPVRSLGTVFQNTGTRALFVNVTAYNNNSLVDLVAFTDASNPPTTDVCDVSLTVIGKPASVFFIVLPGNFYKVSESGAGTPTLNTWTEWI